MGAVKRTHPDVVARQWLKKTMRRLKQSFCDTMGWPVKDVTFEIKGVTNERKKG